LEDKFESVFNHLIVAFDSIRCDAENLRVVVDFKDPDIEVVVKKEVNSEEFGKTAISAECVVGASGKMDKASVDSGIEVLIEPSSILDPSLLEKKVLKPFKVPINEELFVLDFVIVTFVILLARFLHDGSVADMGCFFC
jgi:hypothetical protein